MQNERSEWVTSRQVAFIITSIFSSLGENQDIAHHFRHVDYKTKKEILAKSKSSYDHLK